MGTSSVCFDVLIIDDEENGRYSEIFFLYLYFYNGSLTQFIDTLPVIIYDNEEGQFSYQMKFQT